MIGYCDIGSLDRQQGIWDRAVTPEHFAHLARVTASKAGRGSDPGSWQGTPIDFEKALLELEEEEPYDPDVDEDECPPGVSRGPHGERGKKGVRSAASLRETGVSVNEMVSLVEVLEELK